MKEYSRFFTLVAGILLSLFLVWYGLKSYGLSQPVAEFQTPLVQELIQASQKAPLIWSQNSSDLLLIQASYEEDWTTSSEKTLREALAAAKDKTNLLFFSGRDPKALPSLRKLIKEGGLETRTVFCSRQDGLLEDLRDLEPRWTFCSGEAYFIRLLAFSSLGLESLLQIPSDVVFIHLTTTLANEDVRLVIEEAKRQNKLVLVGPVSRPLEGLNPHGWMVENKDPKVQ